MFDEERNNRKHEKRQDDDETWDNEIESRWKGNEAQNKDDDTPQASATIEPNPDNNKTMDTDDVRVAKRADDDSTFEERKPSEAIESVCNQYQEESKIVEDNIPENLNTSEQNCNNQEQNVENQEGGTTPLFDE